MVVETFFPNLAKLAPKRYHAKTQRRKVEKMQKMQEKPRMT